MGGRTRFNYGKRFGRGMSDSVHGAVQHALANRNVASWKCPGGKIGRIGAQQETSLRQCKKSGSRQPSLPKLKFMEGEE